MRRGFVWLTALVAIWTVGTAAAQSEYRELYDAFEQYQPPAHLFVSPTDTKTATDAKQATYEGERQHLVELKAHWQQELEDLSGSAALYQPEAEVLAGLRRAGIDTSAAQEAVNHEFAQHVVEVLALLRSPAIMSAVKRMRAAVEKYSQVSAVDDILRRYSAFVEGVTTGVGAMPGHGGGGAQFPFPGALALKGRIVTQEVLAAREHLEGTRRDAVTAARRHHWRLWVSPPSRCDHRSYDRAPARTGAGVNYPL